jgi:ribosomal-protein-alanine acetyltransferase
MRKRVRLAKPEDLPRMLKIEEACFGGAERLSEGQLKGLALRIDVLPLAAEADGLVVGFALVHYHGGRARLLTIDVAPEMRGLGLGRALLDAVEAESLARGCGCVGLEVRLSNSRAINMYKKAGYAMTGRLRDYYPDEGGASDALEMEKPLTRPQ